MSKNLLKFIQVSVSITLLIMVAWLVGLFESEGRAEFIRVVVSADIIWLVASIAIGVVINMVSSFKWFMLVRAKGLVVGYWRIFCYYVVGQFYNLFLPTSVGGDVVRSYQLGKYTGRQADALASVFVERYTGVVVLLILSGLAVLSQLSVFSVDFVLFSLLAFAVILGLIGWMVFDPRVYEKFKSWISSIVPASSVIFDKVDKLLASVDRYRNDRGAIAWAFLNSLLFYLFAVLNIYITARVFQIDISLMDMLIATPIIMLIMNLPISMGNIGLMEFAYSSIFQLMGYSPALGLSVAVLMRLKSLVDGALGGVLQPFFVGSAAISNQVEADAQKPK